MKILSLVLGLALTFVLASCNSDSSITTTSAVVSPTPTPTPTAAGFTNEEYAQMIMQTTGLIGYWHMEDDWNDELGTNNGVAQNGASFTDGILGGRGGNFTAAGAGTMVSLPSIVFPEGAVTEFTIEAWVKLTAEPNMYSMIFDITNPSVDDQFAFQFDGFDVLRVYGNAGIRTTTTGTPLTLNTFYHVAVTFDGSEYNFYVNGVVTDTVVSSSAPTVLNTYEAYIGGSVDGWGENFEGTIDEVAIYNRPLTTDELASRYNAGTN